MRRLLAKIEKVNGFGWFIGLLVNVVWMTVLGCGLYWGLIRKIESVQEESARAQGEIRSEIVRVHQLDSLRVSFLQQRGEDVHAALWEAVLRKKDSPPDTRSRRN